MPEFLSNFPQNLLKVDESNIDIYALEIFRYQFERNETYQHYCTLLNRTPESVQYMSEIPYLPIRFFKSHLVQTGSWKAQHIFQSSGTTGMSTSKHYVENLSHYQFLSTTAFEHFYGSLKDYTILALLPSYLERDNSSLVYMVDYFISQTHDENSGFYLNEWDLLHKKLLHLRDAGKKTLLLGVTFGLLDFIETYTIDFPELLVMETGGMKGRREELTRTEVHQRLVDGFGVPRIHSEYGMTELFSQAYSKGQGLFQLPPWAKVRVRDITDPFHYVQDGKSGALNWMDLANVHTCSFIETEDLGKMNPNHTFEVLGRLDNSEVRGCNLMLV